MFKMLFVGCGGSGGAVVGYLMDQLRADFRRAGVDKIPAAWQFVHVDMPPMAEPVAPGLGTIEQLGGHYIPLSPAVGKYSLLDSGVTQSPAVLSEVATWGAREPESIAIPIQLGAGQQRAIGRVAVLSKASSLRQRLGDVVSQVNSPEATAQSLAAIDKVGTLGPAPSAVYTFVVSSMAGGTGASISLDVTRILADLTGNPGMTALFMCTADVFDTLNPENRQGVRANALAMLGELVAAQTGVAGQHDTELFQSLGILASHTGSTFRRIIPLSSFRGQGSPIGDRKPHTVYRVTGQALAALALSHQALGVVRSRVIENATPNTFGDKQGYGWGQYDADVQWGSVGFASLSTGRERLESFAAQWLARQAMDHLLEGHVQQGDERDDRSQAEAMAQAMFGQVCRRMGLPEAVDDASVRVWATATLTPQACQEAARNVVDRSFGSDLPLPAAGVEAQQYVGGLIGFLRGVDPRLLQSVRETGYLQGYLWTQQFLDRLHAAVVEAVGRSGMVYAVALIELLSAHLSLVSQKLIELSQQTQSMAGGFGQHFQQFIAGLQGRIQNATAIDPVRNLYFTRTDLLIRGRWYDVVGSVLAQLNTQTLASLAQSLRTAQEDILRAMRVDAQHDGLATVHTDRYAEWPVAGTLVDSRWGASVNETLLTDYRTFETETLTLLPLSTRGSGESDAPLPLEATGRAVRSVATGEWPTAQGLPSPGGLLVVDRRPTFPALAIDPTSPNQDSIVPALAQYRWLVAPAAVLERATSWVRRPGYAFNDYVTASIRDLAQTHHEPSVVASLFQTLQLADPMTQVDAAAFNSTHALPATISYAFSSIPLDGIAAGEELIAQAPQRGLAQETVDNLRGALTTAGPSRIDVFGYYPLAMPVAHAGVCLPAAQQWAAAATNASQRAAFWDLRRARPLAAALPMTQAERRALVAGWFLGQLTGRVAIPTDVTTGPVAVFDPLEGQWFQLPFPYLTDPNQFRMSQDLLPAVLESSLVALANYGQSTPPGRSMMPYRALRRLWDSNPDGPTNAGFGVTTLNAETVLTDWVKTGTVPAGRPPTARPLPVQESDPVARVDAAKEWIAKVLEHSTQTVGTPGSAYRAVRTPGERMSTPMLRDLYGDLAEVLPSITGLLERQQVGIVPPAMAGPDY